MTRCRADLPDLDAEPRPKFKRRLWLLWLADQDEMPLNLNALAIDVLRDIENMIRGVYIFVRDSPARLVPALAKQRGGGGHRNAAGFQEPAYR